MPRTLSGDAVQRRAVALWWWCAQVKSALRRVPSAVQRLTAAHATTHFQLNRMRSSASTAAAAAASKVLPGAHGAAAAGSSLLALGTGVAAPPLVAALQALLAQQPAFAERAARQEAEERGRAQWLQLAASNTAMLLECLNATVGAAAGSAWVAADGYTDAGSVGGVALQPPDRSPAKDQAARLRWPRAGAGLAL